MNVLAIDIGGTHIKFRTQHSERVLKVKSSPHLTPELMIKAIHQDIAGLDYDHVSIGYPGPVVHDMPFAEPHNLGKGWVCFDFRKAFGNKPLRMINDAAMQALGSYQGGRMLFLGLGTGLGSALVVEGVVQAMELAHLPWRKHKTYEDFLGLRGLERDGHKEWQKNVKKALRELRAALVCEYVVLGGGNGKLIDPLPKHVQLGSNENAFVGAFKLWEPAHANSR